MLAKLNYNSSREYLCFTLHKNFLETNTVKQLLIDLRCRIYVLNLLLLATVSNLIRLSDRGFVHEDSVRDCFIIR